MTAQVVNSLFLPSEAGKCKISGEPLYRVLRGAWVGYRSRADLLAALDNAGGSISIRTTL